MRAISIKQPWAYAITNLGKTFENRTWRPPTSIIGQRIAIHASQRDDPAGAEAVQGITGITPPSDLPRGAIVATAVISEVCYDTDLVEFIGLTDPWFSGPYGWKLDDVQPLAQPVACTGALGVWRMDSETQRAVYQQMGIPPTVTAINTINGDIIQVEMLGPPADWWGTVQTAINEGRVIIHDVIESED